MAKTKKKSQKKTILSKVGLVFKFLARVGVFLGFVGLLLGLMFVTLCLVRVDVADYAGGQTVEIAPDVSDATDTSLAKKISVYIFATIAVVGLLTLMFFYINKLTRISLDKLSKLLGVAEYPLSILVSTLLWLASLALFVGLEPEYSLVTLTVCLSGLTFSVLMFSVAEFFEYLINRKVSLGKEKK